MAITKNRYFLQADRYRWDFKICNTSMGWAQLDTHQDASYFGTWAHPRSYKIVSYTEGDVVETKCDTVEEFCQEIQDIYDFNKEMGGFMKIDPGLNPHMINRWIGIGLDKFFHRGIRRHLV